jgi:hypothetical protein
LGIVVYGAAVHPKIYYPLDISCEKDKHARCTMSIDEVYGRLVDKKTGRPLQGVVVFGYWPSTMDNHQGWQVTVGVARLDETISDKNGDFKLPACYLPNCEIRCYAKRDESGALTLQGCFAPHQPDILFFKEGYYPKGLSNPPGEEPFDIKLPENRQWSWAWNGEIIELEPISDENDPRLKAAYTISPRLYLNESCNWMKIPKTLLFKVKQMQRKERDEKKDTINPARYLLDNFLEKPELCHPQPEQLLLENPSESSQLSKP